MKKLIIPAVALLLVIVLGNTCFFTLREDETAIVQRFGRITAVYVQTATPELRDTIAREEGTDVTVHEGAGLKFKIPFIDTVLPYTHQLISYDKPARVVTTLDKKQLFFNNNAQWRIDNPAQFYKAVKTISVANDRIDNVLYSNMNEKLGKIDAHTLITDKETMEGILDATIKEVQAELNNLGVTIIDIRIKRTDVPEANYESIYERMIAERNSTAALYRSEGDKEAMEIRSGVDKEATIITSEAKKKAEILKGEGDSEAARIFNEAYSSNPEFFEFYNMLDAYRATVGKSSTLVIPLDSPFAKYLLGAPIATN